MPQLDKVTFLSQFFWLSFFYLGFYFLILKFFLPKMSRILKFRRKKSQEGAHILASENEKVRDHFDGMVAKILNTSRTFFAENLQRTENWIDTIVYDINKTHYQGMNTAFIQSVGENSLSDNLALFHAIPTKSEKLYTHHLLTKLNDISR